MFLDLFCALYILVLVEGENISVNVEMYNSSSYCGYKNKNITFYNHTPFSYRISETSFCHGNVFLLNYVQSSSDHFERRRLIRETFGSLKFIRGDPIKLFFVLGLPLSRSTLKLIDQESANYRDIVQANFFDTYRNLTLKHIVALHWIHNFCPQAQFISKSDDDTFVNNFLLHSYLKENFLSQDSFILGQISYGEIPIRTRGYKWTVDKEMFQDEQYPPYMKGFGYILSQKSIEPLLLCSYYKRFLYIDDVFITGLVSESSRVTLKSFHRHFSVTGIKNGTLREDITESIFLVGNNQMDEHLWYNIWKYALFTA